VDIVYCAAAVLDTELEQALAKRLSARVHQGYGVTEMSPATHLVPDNRSDIPPGSTGPAIPNTEFKLVDPVSGKLVTSGPGELWSRGPQAMKGFWRDSARTASAVDSEGFVRHGDMATVDEAGNVTVLDRVADLIVGGDGYALPPAELESLLIAHPGIADAAVIGVNRGGAQVPKALVVRTGDRLTEEEIKRFVAGRMPEHKRVREVEFVDSLPRNIVGKIIRRELREREERMSAQKGSNEQ
jgi:acyl-coenzyme A synthetase/AMP-(fatty) acid ligase